MVSALDLGTSKHWFGDLHVNDNIELVQTFFE